MHSVRLPWPPVGCNPNRARRLHWTKQREEARNYRTACHWEAKAAGLRPMDADEVRVSITFYPPDRRKRDDDNIIASFKAGRDGVADAIGVDDANWRTSYAVERELGGFVLVEITEANENGA